MSKAAMLFTEEQRVQQGKLNCLAVCISNLILERIEEDPEFMVKILKTLVKMQNAEPSNNDLLWETIGIRSQADQLISLLTPKDSKID